MRGLLVLFAIVAALVLVIVLGGRTRVDDVGDVADVDHTASGAEAADPLALDAEDAASDASLRGREATDAPASTPSGPALAGRVVDAVTGAGIPGAVVIAFAGVGGLRMAKTGDDGAYRIARLAPGTWWLFVWHRLYVTAGLDELLREEERGQALMQVVVPEAGSPPDRVLTLSPGRRIEGLVVDDAGAPVAGARIRIYEGEWMKALGERLDASLLGWERYVPLLSGADGRFAVACLPSSFGSIRLGAVKGALYSAWCEPVLLDAGLPSKALELVVGTGATLSGCVRLPDGTPAAEVLVSVAWKTGEAWEETWALEEPPSDVANDEGRWTLAELPPGPIALDADWLDPLEEGSTTELDPLTPGETRAGVSLVVPARYLLRGRLLSDLETPLVEEPLRLRAEAAEKDEFEARASTGEDGGFVFSLLSTGPFEIVHLLPGDEERVLRRGIVLPSEDLVLITQGPTRTRVVLRVVDSEGRSVPGFTSSTYPKGARGRPEFRSPRRTRERTRSGSATHLVAGDPPFWVRVGLARDAEGNDLPLGRVLQRVDSVPSDGVVVVRLPWEDEVWGRIVGPDDQAIPGLRLWLMATEEGEDRRLAAIPVGTDGSWSIRVGEWAELELSVEVQEPPGWTQAPAFGVAPGGRGRTIVLEGGGSVVGRVFAPNGLPSDPDGSPLVVWVSWTDADGDLRSLDVPVGAEGRWRVEGVPLGRDLVVQLLPATVMAAGYRWPKPLEQVRAGGSDVEIRLLPGLTIAGRMVLEDGTAASADKLIVIASPIEKEGTVPATASVSGADARFELTGLAAGTYQLHVLDTRSRVSFEGPEVQAGDLEVLFPLPRRGVLHVRVEGPGAETFRNVDVWVAGTTTLRAGRYFTEAPPFEVSGLPTNEVYVVVTTSLEEGRVAASGGARVGQSVTLKSTESLSLAGRLHRPNGSDDPIKGDLYAVSEDACFYLLLETSGEFKGYFGVAPGRYDLCYVAPDGTETVVARDVEAGREDLVIELP